MLKEFPKILMNLKPLSFKIGTVYKMKCVKNMHRASKKGTACYRAKGGHINYLISVFPFCYLQNFKNKILLFKNNMKNIFNIYLLIVFLILIIYSNQCFFCSSRRHRALWLFLAEIQQKTLIYLTRCVS